MSYRKSTASPGKSPRKSKSIYSINQVINVDNLGDNILQEKLHQAQMLVSQQEIEIERLKTTVVALNAKCSIIDDHKTDVGNHLTNHSESENIRV